LEPDGFKKAGKATVVHETNAGAAKKLNVPMEFELIQISASSSTPAQTVKEVGVHCAETKEGWPCPRSTPQAKHITQ
jgi:hypothetical protein